MNEYDFGSAQLKEFLYVVFVGDFAWPVNESKFVWLVQMQEVFLCFVCMLAGVGLVPSVTSKGLGIC